MLEREAITLYECDVCEWAATTGAPWKRCPHCDTVVPPSAREYVRLSDARHAARTAARCGCHGSAGSFGCEVHGDA